MILINEDLIKANVYDYSTDISYVISEITFEQLIQIIRKDKHLIIQSLECFTKL